MREQSFKYDIFKRPKYIYDEEQLLNYWGVGFKSLDTGKTIRFEVYKDGEYEINQLREFTEFVKECKRTNAIWIGFNNIAYDYQKLHSIIEQTIFFRSDSRDNFYNIPTGDLLVIFFELTKQIISEANLVFGASRNLVPEWKHHIMQIDLFKVWHLNNKAKRTSLKLLEIVFGLDNVEDLPFKYDEYISKEQLDIIRTYNDNDLHATETFWNVTLGNTNISTYKGQNKMNLREELSETYEINLINANDVAIGKEIVIAKLARVLDIETKDLRKLRTYRKFVALSGTIPSFIIFRTDEMNSVRKYYENEIISNSDAEEGIKEG